HVNLAIIRQRLNERDRRRRYRKITARMRFPWTLDGLRLVDPIDDADVGCAIDESADTDRELGLAILAAHQQGRLAVAGGERRGDKRAVIEGRFFVVDDPAGHGVGFALSLPARRI